MSGFEKLKTRLDYRGGEAQQDRMIKDKLRSLKKALLYSYQAGIAVLKNGKEFRCLMNPDRLVPNYDNKELSIPFEDSCLNDDAKGKEIQPIDIKPGDVFKWKQTDSYWLVYLRFWEELAYFRAAVRRCDSEVEINGQKYRVYVKGPETKDIAWHLREDINWNEPNYTIMMYITEDENTVSFFKRFQELKVDGRNYQIVGVNSYKAEGIIQVFLKEYYENTIKEQGYIEPTPAPTPTQGCRIEGDTLVYPYDTKTYVIKEAQESGFWSIDNEKKAKIIAINNEENSVVVEMITGKSGIINLSYKSNNTEETLATIAIQIDSL